MNVMLWSILMFLFGMITIELMNRLLGVNTCFLEIGTDEGTLRGSWR